ncbi:MAG: DsrE family protein [Candidatus Lokiarchaeota archaeon]|nr:DsrE family protein [Candidatus Lokiarchaeota archaeon]
MKIEEKDKKKIFTIVIGDAVYSKERPYTMARFAYTALLAGNKINIFLVEDGVFVGKKNQDPATFDNVEKWINNIIEEGAIIKACGVCLKARGLLEEELIDGIEKTTMNGFLDMCMEADNILFS